MSTTNDVTNDTMTFHEIAKLFFHGNHAEAREWVEANVPARHQREHGVSQLCVSLMAVRADVEKRTQCEDCVDAVLNAFELAYVDPDTPATVRTETRCGLMFEATVNNRISAGKTPHRAVPKTVPQTAPKSVPSSRWVRWDTPQTVAGVWRGVYSAGYGLLEVDGKLWSIPFSARRLVTQLSGVAPGTCIEIQYEGQDPTTNYKQFRVRELTT